MSLCVPLLLVVIACGLLPVTVFAGKLDAFEDGARQEQPRDACHRKRNGGSRCADTMSDLLLKGLGLGMLYGGAASWARVDADSSAYDMDVVPREAGEPLIPFVRFDVSYHDVESDVDAYDYRVEGGYGPFAIQFNQTHYSEESPDDELDLFRFYGMYRMSFGTRVEVDLGLGALTIDGNDNDTRFSLTLPVRIYPCDWFGVEIRPAWADGVTDVDVGLLLTKPYASLKAGYRWVSSPSETLNGPYAGLAVHF